MPRRARIFVEGLIYHVYNRVGRGEAPFNLDDEAHVLWSLLREAKARDGLTVYAWCIMPNHYHLLVRTGSVPLWRSIRFVQHRYAVLFNRRCKVMGPVWQARYKARPVSAEASLLRVIAYVHSNPVTARMVGDPGRYRWGGHRELIRPSKETLLDVDEVLALFGGTRGQALRAYSNMIRREAKQPRMGTGVEALPWWRDEPLVAPAPRIVDALGASAGPVRRRLALGEFLSRVSGLVGVSPEELASPLREAGILDARELIAALAVERWGIGVKALAEALGKSRDGVSHWVRRAAKRRGTDARFARRLERLDACLAREAGGTGPGQQFS